MSYQKRYSWKEELEHRDRRLQKLEQLQGLQSLLETWETHLEPDDPYLRNLKKRIRTVENQYHSMQP